MVRAGGTWRSAVGDAPSFPDPRTADRDGLVAVGGSLAEDRLILAYECGIFPWYDAGLPPLWWSPDPRAVLDPDHLHLSRSLRRRLRKGGFQVTLDRAFEDVMRACAAGRTDGTWILPEMIDAYAQLFVHGHAHSFEVWMDGTLAGGLYGVHVGGLFAAESMFHRRSDGSKIALVTAVATAFDAGIELFDVQFVTPHLASLGAYTLSREQYLARLARAREKSVDLCQVLPRWPP
ncbi:MAG: leucyl/phenylalanyl-tRNA--protein transferase [Polyangiaceae bacterium]|nr:leucyl/phenylalanyl-tRNA--protein transferase [Polyangiaceae bacterium]